MNRDATPGLALVPTVRVDIDGGGPLSEEFVERLRSACDQVEDASTPSVLELRIQGAAHASGVAAWPGEVHLNQVHRWEQLLRRLDRFDGVSVALASGVCGTAALDLLAAADHRIVSSDFRLRLLCGSGASWPGMALYRLANRNGPAAARRLFMFTGEVQAAQSVQLGLADEVAAEMEAARGTFIAALNGLELDVLPARRLLVAESLGRPYEESLGTHLAACDVELRRRVALASHAASAPVLAQEEGLR